MMKSQKSSNLKNAAKSGRTVSSSLQKNRHKKMDSKPIDQNKKTISIKENNNKCGTKQKIICVDQQKTEPIKRKRQKQIKQEKEQFNEKFKQQFKEFTKIYIESHQIQNEQEHSLLCLDEILDDSLRPQKKNSLFNSTFNRFSQKSISQLPSIAEKDVEEQREDEIIFTHQKRFHSNLSTASNYQTKNTKNIKDKYINDFDLKLRAGSHQKKLAIDVQNLIKSRSKAKSSMSDQSGKRVYKY